MAPLVDGTVLGHYVIAGRLGQGGMGVVYKARDKRLNRWVALKVLLPDAIAPDEWRFLQEARAASALNHPNLVTIYEMEPGGDSPFIAMELIEGRTLADQIRESGLSISEAIAYGAQIASALAVAHAQGIVHRDLKPANIMVTTGGVVKVLDFGLAKLTKTSAPADEATVSMHSAHTAAGVVLGTAAYMSPEQAEGKTVDARSDIFSFGSVLYEMVTRKRAFEGSSSMLSILSAILRVEPVPVQTLVAKAPAGLNLVISQCLRKDPAERIQSMEEVKAQLEVLMARTSSEQRASRSRVPIAVAAVVVLLVAGFSARLWLQSRNAAWAYQQAMPEIRRLVNGYDYTGALGLVERAAVYLPDDAGLAELRENASLEVPVTTSPAGVVAAIRPYGSADWRVLGSSPIDKVRIPRGWMEWRFSKEGYAETTRLLNSPARVNVSLPAAADVPAGMVFVPGVPAFDIPVLKLTHLDALPIGDFYIDKFEVTNRQFKQFVEQGGYKRQEFWKQPFIHHGKKISFEEAIAQFTDKTGLPGPSTWEVGSYAPEQDDFPVTGVSWYEAAAYAEFAGKSLPPIGYWGRAAVPNAASHLFVPHSNFGGAGTRAVGTSSAMNVLGIYDVAGNAKEWCWNEAGENSGMRYILGGGFNEPTYLFNDADAQSAFARQGAFGFRLVKYPDAAALPASVTGPATALKRDYLKEKPVSDEVFKQFASYYEYDKTPLESVVEYSKEEKYWTKTKVVYDAAYNHEKIPAFLFLPKNTAPPYQTVVYFPGASAQNETNSDNIDFDRVSFLVRSGRALLFPVYKGTYERGDGARMALGTTAHRDRRVQQYQDLARSVDYLETRNEIDINKLAYYGVSWGGGMGAHFPALENRFKVSVLAMGGFLMEPVLPVADSFNFASRVTIPTLMLSGRYDYTFPVEQSQIPFFNLLGTPKEHKRHQLFDIGHAFLPIEFARESLAWLDKYLGPPK